MVASVPIYLGHKFVVGKSSKVRPHMYILALRLLVGRGLILHKLDQSLHVHHSRSTSFLGKGLVSS